MEGSYKLVGSISLASHHLCCSADLDVGGVLVVPRPLARGTQRQLRVHRHTLDIVRVAAVVALRLNIFTSMKIYFQKVNKTNISPGSPGCRARRGWRRSRRSPRWAGRRGCRGCPCRGSRTPTPDAGSYREPRPRYSFISK